MIKRFKPLTECLKYALVAVLVSGFVQLKLNATNLVVESSLQKSLDGLMILDAYMPQIPPVSRTAAVYLTFKNESNEAVTLTNVEVEFARHTMFHRSIEIDGVAKMKHLDKLVIKPNQSLELKPGGTHIMLMGLGEIPTSGQFELILYSQELSKKVLVSVRSNQ